MQKNGIYLFLLIIYLVFASHRGTSQNKEIDSLLILLKTDKTDTNKITHLHNLCMQYYLKSSYDTALYYANLTLKETKNLPASSFSGPNGADKLLARIYSNIGLIYSDQGDYPNALLNYLEGLRIAEKIKNKKTLAKTLSGIGVVHYRQRNYEKALDYYQKALKIDNELNDKNGMGKRFANIGLLYYEQGDNISALKYYFSSLRIAEELGDKNGIVTDYGNIGVAYFEMKEFSKALDYYFRALKMLEELGEQNDMAIHYGNIGIVYIAQKKYNDAEIYLLKALAISKTMGALELQKDHYRFLSELYSLKKDHKRALEYYRLYTSTKDSIFNENKNEELTRHELNYEFEKKAAAIKAEQDKKDAVALAEGKKQRMILLLVSGVLVLMIVFAFFIFRSLRITRQQKILIEIKNKETEEQKKVIEEKNKDILDSIHYAKRIQSSLLPTEKYIARNLKK